MIILVTGGAGFIGSHIVEYLVQRGDIVIVLDNLSNGKMQNMSKVSDDINFVNGDVRDYNLVEQLVKDSNDPTIKSSIKLSKNIIKEFYEN